MYTSQLPTVGHWFRRTPKDNNCATDATAKKQSDPVHSTRQKLCIHHHSHLSEDVEPLDLKSLLHALNLADVVPSAYQMECVAHKYSHVDAVFREHGEICADGSLNLLNENG